MPTPQNCQRHLNNSTDCLSVFDHFVELALKGLINIRPIFLCYSPRKHQETKRFSDAFQRHEKGKNGLKLVKVVPYSNCNRNSFMMVAKQSKEMSTAKFVASAVKINFWFIITVIVNIIAIIIWYSGADVSFNLIESCHV